MLDEAKKYTELGWIVHPLKAAVQGNKSTGKAPIEGQWQHRLAPRNDDELDQFFNDGSKHNIGLLCGQRSNVTVIDIDDDLFLYDILNGMDQSTWVMSSRTGETHRGHIYFKYDQTLKSQKHHTIGIEILNDGNNCVLPPSQHYTGSTYQWNTGKYPNELPEFPEKLKQRLQTIFKLEAKYKKLRGQMRPCFRNFLDDKNIEKLHGGDGRLYAVALFTEMAAAADELKMGLQERNQIIHFTARLIYRDDYDKARTSKELAGIDPRKTWKCETLKETFYDRCNCDECKYKNEETGTTPKDKAKAALDQAGESFKDLLAMAEQMQEKVPIYYDNTGSYWIWVGDGYQMVDETDILIGLKNSMGLRSITNSKVRTGALEAIKVTGREREVAPTEKTWLHFKNCVIDYETGEMFDAKPDRFFTTPIPHDLGDAEDTPTIDRLLEEWIGPDLKLQLYEILAYCLIDGYPIHRIFTLIGAGRNGKGQFMKLIRRFIGSDACTSTEMERLVDSRFETAKLFNKRAAFIGETNFSAISKTSRLKQLSGEDLVTGEFKRKTPFDFENTAKIIVATNSMPTTHDRTDGFYSRWLVIEFNNRFPEGSDLIDPIPEWEFENLARKSLRILGDLLKRGGFYKEGSIEERAKKYEEKSNPVAAFVKTHCEQDEDKWVPLYELFDIYDVFQAKHGYRKITKRQFSTQLQELGYDKEKGRIEDFTGVYFFGLAIKSGPGSGPGLQDELPVEKTEEEQEKEEKRKAKQASPANVAQAERDILEAVKKYTEGSMHVRNIDAFIQYYLDTHPYAKRVDIEPIAKRMKQIGWKLTGFRHDDEEDLE
jgi:P4 family phage/plasmid primase-like protien